MVLKNNVEARGPNSVIKLRAALNHRCCHHPRYLPPPPTILNPGRSWLLVFRADSTGGGRSIQFTRDKRETARASSHDVRFNRRSVSLVKVRLLSNKKIEARSLLIPIQQLRQRGSMADLRKLLSYSTNSELGNDYGPAQRDRICSPPRSSTIAWYERTAPASPEYSRAIEAGGVMKRNDRNATPEARSQRRLKPCEGVDRRSRVRFPQKKGEREPREKKQVHDPRSRRCSPRNARLRSLERA